MTKIIISLLMVISLLGVFPLEVLGAGFHPSKPLVVAPTGSAFSSIQAAIDAASPGETILVKTGNYQEDLVLNKPLKLIGEGSPVIDGGGKGDVITILADNSTIEGFTITNSGYDLSKDEAGIKVKSNNNLISNNKLLGNTWGIYLYAASSNIISNNLIKGREELAESERGNGIHLWKAENNKIENNELTKNRDALYFSFANNNLICNNRAYEQRYGVHYMYSDHNKLEHNVLSDNSGGMAMMYSQNNEIRGNQVYRNTFDGILGRDLDDNNFESNIIYNNRQGFFMYNANRNNFTSNLIAANMIGLHLTAGSDSNIFVQNSWEQNMEQVKLPEPLNNKWDDGKTGNYWSDYTGFDLDNDGYGDSTYWQNSLTEYLVGKFPLIKLFFNSPAMQAIETAEKAFPVLRPDGVVDRFPLIHPGEIQVKELKIDWNQKFEINPSEEAENRHLHH